MVRKLVAVMENAAAGSCLIRVLMGLRALSTLLGSRLRLRSILLLCILLHLPTLLVLQSIVKSCILVQVEIEGLLAACEVFVSLRYVRTVLLNLLDLLQVLSENFGGMRRIVPSGCFLDNRLDRGILNDRFDVDGVVHAAEDAALVGVWDIYVFKELEPECFKLLSVILKEVKVVTDCGKDFVEVFLEITAVFLHSQLAPHLNLIGKLVCILATFC